MNTVNTQGEHSMPRPSNGYQIEIDGNMVNVPGVSSVISQVGWGAKGLQRWAHKLGMAGLSVDSEMRIAADVGTAVHEFVDARVWGRAIGLIPKLNEEQVRLARSAASAWVKFDKTHEVKPHITELSLTCPPDRTKTGFGGTFDFLGWIDGVPTLGDFKTSKKCYGKVLLQLAGYLDLLDQNSELTAVSLCMPEQIAVFRLDKESGTPEAMRWRLGTQEVAAARRGFDLCRELYTIESVLNKAMTKTKSRWDRKELGDE